MPLLCNWVFVTFFVGVFFLLFGISVCLYMCMCVYVRTCACIFVCFHFCRFTNKTLLFVSCLCLWKMILKKEKRGETSRILRRELQLPPRPGAVRRRIDSWCLTASFFLYFSFLQFQRQISFFDSVWKMIFYSWCAEHVHFAEQPPLFCIFKFMFMRILPIVFQRPIWKNHWQTDSIFWQLKKKIMTITLGGKDRFKPYCFSFLIYLMSSFWIQ